MLRAVPAARGVMDVGGGERRALSSLNALLCGGDTTQDVMVSGWRAAGGKATSGAWRAGKRRKSHPALAANPLLGAKASANPELTPQPDLAAACCETGGALAQATHPLFPDSGRERSRHR